MIGVSLVLAVRMITRRRITGIRLTDLLLPYFKFALCVAADYGRECQQDRKLLDWHKLPCIFLFEQADI